MLNDDHYLIWSYRWIDNKQAFSVEICRIKIFANDLSGTRFLDSLI